MTAKPFLLQAEELRAKRKYAAAGIMYHVAAQYAIDKAARKELIEQADDMAEAAWEVAELQRLWERS